MSAAPVVTTTAGPVAGEWMGEVAAGPPRAGAARFLGIPYAAPPVGDLRFRAPRPPRPWSRVRPARAFGPAAPQTAGLPSRLPSFSVSPWAEDCLTLNVWTPGLDGARPVLVWLHGGAYLGGGTAMSVFDGARLATEGDVVVVTVNYRLGALGYLALDPDTDDGDANCGLRDQHAALRWVYDHATAFGGDTDAVTVFGESAGGGSVLHLCVARDRAPFRRAISQSGEARTLATELAHRVRDVFARALGVDADGAAQVAALRSVPVERLLAAQESVFPELARPTGLMPFHPTYDGSFVDLDPIAGFRAGRARGLGLVIGTTRDELRLWADPRARDIDDDRLADLLGRLAGPGADPARMIAVYRAGPPPRSGSAIWETARTDAVLRVPALRVADAHATHGDAAFVYRFDWESPGIGAAHATDLPFTFGTFDRDGWGAAVGADDAAAALGRALRAAWCAFARTGDPSHPGLGRWPRHDPRTRPTMCFARESRVVLDPDGAARACWMPDPG